MQKIIPFLLPSYAPFFFVSNWLFFCDRNLLNNVCFLIPNLLSVKEAKISTIHGTFVMVGLAISCRPLPSVDYERVFRKRTSYPFKDTHREKTP